jgi:hypothetical protein
VAIKGKYFFQLMYFLHENFSRALAHRPDLVKKSRESVGEVTGMSAGFQWHLDCSCSGGARDTGDDNITSCSRFLVAVVRTATGKQRRRSIPTLRRLFFVC